MSRIHSPIWVEQGFYKFLLRRVSGFITDLTMPSTFINLIIRFGMSASCVQDKEYPKKLNKITLANILLLRHILLGTGSSPHYVQLS